MNSSDWAGILGIIGVIIVIVIFASQCQSNPELDTIPQTTETGIEYKYFTINGMPCVYVEQGIGQSKTGGPDCDWSKWKGAEK